MMRKEDGGWLMLKLSGIRYPVSGIQHPEYFNHPLLKDRNQGPVFPGLLSSFFTQMKRMEHPLRSLCQIPLIPESLGSGFAWSSFRTGVGSPICATRKRSPGSWPIRSG